MKDKKTSIINVTIVSDSIARTELLLQMLQHDPDIRVVNLVKVPSKAVASFARLRSDLITIDTALLGKASIQLIHDLMQGNPIPIIALVEHKNDTLAQNLLNAGALAVIPFSSSRHEPVSNQLPQELIRTIKTMAEVKVVKRRAIQEAKQLSSLPTLQPNNSPKLVVIGASTGGPLVLKFILENLNPEFSVPIIIVQHIAESFTEGLISWLAQYTPMTIRLAQHKDIIQPNCIYVAPEGSHLLFDCDGQVLLSNDLAIGGHRPSIDLTLQAVAQCYGPSALGVLLTGMGKDGARGLLAMRQSGAITIAQDAESSAVYGMPAAAVELCAVEHLQAPKAIVATINRWAFKKNNNTEAKKP